MLRLTSPLQFEQRLSALNQIRPLGIRDRIRYQLSLPTADMNPVDGRGIVQGKQLRGSDLGGLINSGPSTGYTAISNEFVSYGFASGHWYYDFPGEVNGCIIDSVAFADMEIDWVTPDLNVIARIGFRNTKYFAFRGTRIHFDRATMGVFNMYYIGFLIP